MNNATILRELNHVGRREGDGMTEGERIVQEWRESGNPAEAPSLPHTSALGHGGGKVSGEAETAAESGEIQNVSFRMMKDDWSQVTATVGGTEYTFTAPDGVAIALLELSKAARKRREEQG